MLRNREEGNVREDAGDDREDGEDDKGEDETNRYNAFLYKGKGVTCYCEKGPHICDERTKRRHMAGKGIKVVEVKDVSATDVLHHMITTHKTDSQVRADKRMDRKRGIKTPGLSQAKKVSTDLTTEMVCGTVEMLRGKEGEEECYQAAYAHIKSPLEYLTARYTEIISDRLYVCRPYLTKEDEVCLRFSGDKGAGRTLLTLALINQDKPNAVDNTDIIIAYDGDERTHNLQIALEKCQLKEMMAMWTSCGIAGKRVKIWWGGDLLFLSELMGHTCGNASHPCVFCTMHKSEFDDPDNDAAHRTYGSFLELHQAWQLAIRSQGLDLTNKKHLKKAKDLHKEFYNVKKMPLNLHYLFDQAMAEILFPPDLHILLEVGKRGYYQYHDILLRLDYTPAGASAMFVLPKNKDARALKFGRLTKIFEAFASKKNIKNKKYWGTLQGNRCHKLFTDEITTSFKDLITRLINEEADANRITNQVKEEAMAELRSAVMHATLFTKVHTKISHSRAMSDEEIEMAAHSIRVFMEYYRKGLQQKVYLKLHVLEKHIVPWLRTYKMGLGPVSEQGVESAHHDFNNLLDRHALQMRSKEEAFKWVLQRLAIQNKCRHLKL